MANKLQLAEVVQALREELDVAKYSSAGHDIKFNVNNIEVEFQTAVELDTTVEGGGKIKFWVLDVDAKASGKYKRSNTHKIKLSLEPVDTENGVATNEKVRISGRAKRIS
ncbi:MAG: trypco2 family protein [Thiolinea sp.]